MNIVPPAEHLDLYSKIKEKIGEFDCKYWPKTKEARKYRERWYRYINNYRRIKNRRRKSYWKKRSIKLAKEMSKKNIPYFLPKNRNEHRRSI